MCYCLRYYWRPSYRISKIRVCVLEAGNGLGLLAALRSENLFMIVVKIEMWPRGDESKAQVFGLMTFTNIGGATLADPTQGDYQVNLCGGVYGRKDLLKKVWKRTRVIGFDRARRRSGNERRTGASALYQLVRERNRGFIADLPEGFLKED